jgi:hypothetical protein
MSRGNAQERGIGFGCVKIDGCSRYLLKGAFAKATNSLRILTPLTTCEYLGKLCNYTTMGISIHNTIVATSRLCGSHRGNGKV